MWDIWKLCCIKSQIYFVFLAVNAIRLQLTVSVSINLRIIFSFNSLFSVWNLNFLELKVTTSDVLFCQNPKDIQFMMIENTDKMQIVCSQYLALQLQLES